MLVFNLKLMYPTGDSDKNFIKKKKRRRGKQKQLRRIRVVGKQLGKWGSLFPGHGSLALTRASDP